MENGILRYLLWDNWLVKYLLYPILVGYLLVMCAIIFFSGKLLFPSTSNGSSYQDTSEIIKLPTFDGVKISAKYLPNEGASYAILYSHGNGEDLGGIDKSIRRFNQMGFVVVAYDYHGYGTSGGAATEKSTYYDIDAAYAYMRNELNIPADRIILYGFSLGGAPSVDLAARKPIAGLILESTFTSAFSLFIDLPGMPLDKFENLKKIKGVHCPVLVIHGRADRTIPIKQGEMLYQAANEPKLYLWVEEAGHNDVQKIAEDEYWRKVGEFMQLVIQNPVK